MQAGSVLFRLAIIASPVVIPIVAFLAAPRDALSRWIARLAEAKTNTPPRARDPAVLGQGTAGPLALELGSASGPKANASDDPRQYSPPEWDALTAEAKGKLADLLSWENLSRWDFDIVELAELSRNASASEKQFCPLLFVGWAILCGPAAQGAMRLSLAEGSVALESDDAGGDEKSANSHRYRFQEDLDANPRIVCNFLREIESRYKADNPYHNNVHAADVTQTTHSLLQMMGERYLSGIDSVTIFSLLLAATFHDVGHPGTSNLFQKNSMSELAIKYNDVSILENMHSAVGHSLLLGEEKRDEWDVFGRWTRDQKIRSREVMITSIMATDMSKHFALIRDLGELVGEVRILADKVAGDNTDDADGGESAPRLILSIIAQTLNFAEQAESLSEGEASALAKLKEEFKRLQDSIWPYMLHCADIANSAKKEENAVYWAYRVRDEFFAQGDIEKKMGLPVSPLCDRETVVWHESQVGFAGFMIRPAFELLGSIIPRVKEDVEPNIGRTIEYWKRFGSCKTEATKS